MGGAGKVILFSRFQPELRRCDRRKDDMHRTLSPPTSQGFSIWSYSEDCHLLRGAIYSLHPSKGDARYMLFQIAKPCNLFNDLGNIISITKKGFFIFLE